MRRPQPFGNGRDSLDAYHNWMRIIMCSPSFTSDALLGDRHSSGRWRDRYAAGHSGHDHRDLLAVRGIFRMLDDQVALFKLNCDEDVAVVTTAKNR
jgi:hypothetical protein